jgi:hypothetical protein
MRLAWVVVVLILSLAGNVWQWERGHALRQDCMEAVVQRNGAEARAKYGAAFQVSQFAGMPAVFDSRSADLYTLTTAGIVRVNFLTGHKDLLPLKNVPVEEWRTNFPATLDQILGK